MRSIADAGKSPSFQAHAAMPAFAAFMVLLLIPLSAGAQSNPPPATPTPAPPSVRQKFFFGGGIGLSFGDVDYVELAPLIGYRFLPKLDGGMQLIYQYQHDSRYPEDVTLSNYGANLFTRYFVAPSFFVEAEYEHLNYEFVLPSLDTERSNFDSFLAGGGFGQPIGHGAGFYLSALYNFSYNSTDLYSPYTDPWNVQAGVTVGF